MWCARSKVTGGAGAGHPSVVGATAAGSLEDRSRILAFRAGGQGKDTVQGQQLTTQQQMLAELKKLAGRDRPGLPDNRPDALGDRPMTQAQAFRSIVGGPPA